MTLLKSLIVLRVIFINFLENFNTDNNVACKQEQFRFFHCLLL